MPNIVTGLLLELTLFSFASGTFLLGSSVFLAQTATLPASLDLADPNVVAAGAVLFSKNCSVGYCHGSGGRAGRGPRLRGREWDKHYLFRVTYDGIPNSSMPGWKNRLTENEIGSIVAYVLVISKLNADDPEPSFTPKVLSEAAEPATAAAAPVRPPRKESAAALKGDPENGRMLFFDSSNDLNCGVCHKIRGIGNDIGPDLNSVSEKPARDIFKDIVLPSASLSASRPLLKITLKTGETVKGVKVQGDATHLKVYDVEGVPPVQRSLAKDQVYKQEMQDRSAMPDKYGEIYTVKQLLDIIAFIKQKSSAGSKVSVEDIF
jgi:putative heme-binding domain-containing protein